MLDDISKVESIRRLRRVLAVIRSAESEPEATGATTMILVDFLREMLAIVPSAIRTAKDLGMWDRTRMILAALKVQRPAEWAELDECIRELGAGELVEDLPVIPDALAGFVEAAATLVDEEPADEPSEPTEDDVNLWARAAMQSLAEHGIVVPIEQARAIVLRHYELIEAIGDADDAEAAGHEQPAA